MSDEDGLAQLVSSYGSDKSSSEDDQLEEIQCKTDQCDKDSDNFYDNIAEARWVVCDMLNHVTPKYLSICRWNLV